jgi:hypothetical protein
MAKHSEPSDKQSSRTIITSRASITSRTRITFENESEHGRMTNGFPFYLAQVVGLHVVSKINEKSLKIEFSH